MGRRDDALKSYRRAIRSVSRCADNPTVTNYQSNLARQPQQPRHYAARDGHPDDAKVAPPGR